MSRFLRVALALLTIGSAHALEKPAATALDFLRAVASGNATEHPEEHSALSPSLAPERRREIVRQLHSLRSTIEPNHLTVIEEKIDGDLAAVLIRQQLGHDPSSFQIHPVGLIRSPNGWQAAPLPASFDGTGLAFRSSLLPQARQLETWMLDSRGKLLASAQDEIRRNLEAAMRKAVPPDFLSESTPQTIVERFITAAGQNDLPTVLALLGGLQPQLPRDYESQSQFLIRLLRPNAKLPFAWKLLTSQNSLRTIIHAEQNSRSAIVTVACINPIDSKSPTLKPFAIHFPLVHTTEGQWHLNLPQNLRASPSNPAEEPEESVIDNDILRRMPEQLTRQFPSQPQTSATAARDAWITALRTPTPQTLIPLIQLGDPPSFEPLLRSLEVWSSLYRGPGTHAILPLAFEEQADDAGLLVQLFSTSRPGLARIHLIHFTRTPQGWLGIPTTNPETSPICEKLLTQGKKLRTLWPAETLPKIPFLDEPITPETSEKLFSDWLAACTGNDLVRLLSLSSRIEDDDGLIRSLRCLSQHLIPKPQAHLLAIHQKGRWSAATVTFGEGKTPPPVLLLAGQTAKGPKILLSVLLKSNPDPDEDPGRAYLNRESISFINDKLGQEASEELDQLLQLHHKTLVEKGNPR